MNIEFSDPEHAPDHADDDERFAFYDPGEDWDTEDDPEPHLDHHLPEPAPRVPQCGSTRFAVELARFLAEGIVCADEQFTLEDRQLDDADYPGSTPVRSVLKRCAIFGIGDTHRVWRDSAIYMVAFGRHIRLTGYELRQLDESVVLEINSRLRGWHTGDPFQLDANEIVRAMRWSHGAQSAARLASSLLALAHARITIVNFDSSTTRLRLFDEVRITADQIVGKASGGLALFQDAGGRGTYVPLERRRSLREGLQTWLAGWVLATKCDQPVALTTLFDHSGTRQKRMGDFGREVRRALERLQQVGFVTRWNQEAGGRDLSRNAFRISKAKYLR